MAINHSPFLYAANTGYPGRSGRVQMLPGKVTAGMDGVVSYTFTKENTRFFVEMMPVEASMWEISYTLHGLQKKIEFFI